jgi:pyruvate dehydrogenase E1 component alpha subunit
MNILFVYFSYRTREEIQDVRKSRDPITSFREKVIQANLATDEEFKVYSFLFFL